MISFYIQGMSTINNNKRLFKNSIFLYLRMLLLMIVGLYTSRVLLKTIGISDFGLYNVVGGVVTMFTFFNTTLASATQRFLSYAIGKNDNVELKNVFSTALILHFIFGIVIVFLSETIGLWYIHNKLNVSTERINAAVICYHLSVCATFVAILQVPYNASLIAREKMDIYAYLSIVDAILKFFVVFVLSYFTYDSLIVYGCLIMIATMLTTSVYVFYCHKKFPECRLSKRIDKYLFNNIVVV